MKKTSLGRKSSTRFGVDRKSGIPVRAHSSDRLSATGSDPFFLSATRSQSIGNLNKLFLATPGPMGTERPGRSMAQSSSGMSIRSSGARSSIGTSKKRDNRELTDKAWQVMAMDLIVDVIRTHGGHDILNRPQPQPLKPLSMATFTECCNFLFKLIDPTTEINKTNMVPQLMYLSKKLLYRGKVEKSWIIAANTPHAFPYAIGFLHFLATLVRFMTQTNPLEIMYPRSFESKEPDSDEGIEWDFKKLLGSFVQISMIRGREDFEYHRNRIQDQVVQEHVEADNCLSLKSTIESQTAKLSEEKEKLQREVDEKSESVSFLEIECEKSQKQVNDLQNRLKKAQSTVQEKEKLIKEVEADLGAMKKEIERREILRNEINKQIGAQNFSRQDLEKAQQQITCLANKLESQKKYKEGFVELLYKVDLELCKLTEELEDGVRNLNLKVKEFASVDPEIEAAAIPRNSFQNEDFVRSAQIISALVNKYKDLDLTLMSEITGASSRNKELKDKYDELMKKKASLENKVTASRAQYEALSREVNEAYEELDKEKERLIADLPEEVSDDGLTSALEKAKITLAESEKTLVTTQETANGCLDHMDNCLMDLRKKLRELGVSL